MNTSSPQLPRYISVLAISHRHVLFVEPSVDEPRFGSLCTSLQHDGETDTGTALRLLGDLGITGHVGQLYQAATFLVSYSSLAEPASEMWMIFTAAIPSESGGLMPGHYHNKWWVDVPEHRLRPDEYALVAAIYAGNQLHGSIAATTDRSHFATWDLRMTPASQIATP